jgi:hypothetical protein
MATKTSHKSTSCKSRRNAPVARASSPCIKHGQVPGTPYGDGRATLVVRPLDKQTLQQFVRDKLGLNIPDKKICDEHASPMDYLWHSFNSDFTNPAPTSADCVVWANRGGGKTQIAAIATLLDCIFKPDCQVRILGGSEEQSGRMYNYLTAFLRNGFDGLLAAPVRKDKCLFKNGSAAEVVTQSQTSVRGLHIQKLRCDEVELFDPDVFSAAQFTTMSRPPIIASLESISTMHKPYGIMHKIIADAKKANVPVFKWCIWETIEKCIGRSCSACPLQSDCRGRAKEAAGFLKIDDCITMMRRSSRAAWESEMLCKRPSLEKVVFDEFDAENIRPIDFNPNLPLYRAIDFGFVNPFVCLWIQVDEYGVVRVIDEYYRSRATLDIHADKIKKLTLVPEEKVSATFCDPAGGAVEQSSGQSQVNQLRSMGIKLKFRPSGILEGIELIRRAIKSGDGKMGLIVSPKCPRLIEALQCYSYPDSTGIGSNELPLKDGLYDHPIDALRYFFVNLSKPDKATSRYY